MAEPVSIPGRGKETDSKNGTVLGGTGGGKRGGAGGGRGIVIVKVNCNPGTIALVNWQFFARVSNPPNSAIHLPLCTLPNELVFRFVTFPPPQIRMHNNEGARMMTAFSLFLSR